jgi:hypothetical protein
MSKEPLTGQMPANYLSVSINDIPYVFEFRTDGDCDLAIRQSIGASGALEVQGQYDKTTITGTCTLDNELMVFFNNHFSNQLTGSFRMNAIWQQRIQYDDGSELINEVAFEKVRLAERMRAVISARGVVDEMSVSFSCNRWDKDLSNTRVE